MIPDPIELERRKDGSWHLRWQTAPTRPVTVFGGSHPQRIDYSRPLAQGRDNPLSLQFPDGERGGYFCLEMDGESRTVASRRVPLDNSPNFRDFGGYQTASGRRVRWGQLFRSGHLANLSAEDMRHFGMLCIDVVCDLRHAEEQRRQPPSLPATDAPHVFSLAILPGSAQSFFRRLNARLPEEREDPAAMADFLCQVNRQFPFDHVEQYSEMFRRILGAKRGVLVNCTAGKDRTGFAAAMILAALGAPRETLMEDYMLSGRYTPISSALKRMKKLYGDAFASVAGAEALRPMLETRSEYLQSAFASIDERYPSMEAYLEEVLGVDAQMRAELQHRFLEQDTV